LDVLNSGVNLVRSPVLDTICSRQSFLRPKSSFAQPEINAR